MVVRVGERERKRVEYDYRRDVEGILVMGLFCILTAVVESHGFSHAIKLHRTKHTYALTSAHKPMKCK